MSTARHGGRAIAKVLNAEGIPSFGGGLWEEAYIRKIIRGRAVLGEYQPMQCRRFVDGEVVKTSYKRPTRTPDGPPIPNYYPAAVTEERWWAAQGVLSEVWTPQKGELDIRDTKHVAALEKVLARMDVGA